MPCVCQYIHLREVGVFLFSEAYCPAPPSAPINAQIRRDLPEGELLNSGR